MTPRTRRRRLTDEAVARLKPKAKRYSVPDPELIGHYVRVMPSGVRSFCAVARDPLLGKQVWTTIGNTDHVGIEEARTKAREIIGRVKRGLRATEPPAPAPDSFATVAEDWIKRHVEAKGLRTEREIRRCLSKYVTPRWGAIPFRSIRRGDTARLLDHIEDNHGARQADAVFAILNSINNWCSARDDDFMPFTRRGMKRATNRPRQRTLTDDEIRMLWRVAEESGDAFSNLLCFALLSGQRKSKYLDLRRSHISADGIWTVATAEREKGNAGTIQLPELALTVLRRLPRIHNSDFVFSLNGRRMSTSHAMDVLRSKLPERMRDFTCHDARRTFRTLASRVNVDPRISERLLGHVTGSAVEQIYDRHGYDVEKKAALERIARLVEDIVNGPPADGKIVPLKAARS